MTPMLRRSKSFSRTAGLWLRYFLGGATAFGLETAFIALKGHGFSRAAKGKKEAGL
jgi:hypothetical protein